MASTYYVKSAPQIDVADISHRVLDRLIEISDMQQFHADLHYLHSKGISQRKVARTLKVPHGCFWNWMHRCEPTAHSLFYIMAVREWAKALQEQEQQQSKSESQPHVLQS